MPCLIIQMVKLVLNNSGGKALISASNMIAIYVEACEFHHGGAARTSINSGNTKTTIEILKLPLGPNDFRIDDGFGRGGFVAVGTEDKDPPRNANLGCRDAMGGYVVPGVIEVLDDGKPFAAIPSFRGSFAEKCLIFGDHPNVAIQQCVLLSIKSLQLW